MVDEFMHEGRRLRLCGECGLGYETRRLAQECEEFCLANNACSPEITRRAVYVPKAP